MQKAGTVLRQAREHAGLSAEQIAERTKFKLYRIVALETGDYDNLPQGIYLDGIVRAYTHELGIDAEPMVAQVRLERGKLPGDMPIAFQEPVEFERPPVAPDAAISPSASNAPSRSTVALALLALLAVCGWGAYFYEASRAANQDVAGKIYAALTAQKEPHAPPIAFVDDTQVRVSAPTHPPVQNTVRSTNAIQDLTGTWRLATQVESSSYSRYEGLLLGYEMDLEQDGDSVSGVGRKVIENGDALAKRAQTPIAVNGTVDGDRLSLDFIESGARRSTQGTFNLMRDRDGVLRGRFTSNAARSAGSVEARPVR